MAHHVVIIGNGISGITCARELRKRSDARITIISSETEHFFARTALMYVYMGHMKYQHTKPYEDWFWSKNKLDLLHDKVLKVDAKAKLLQLEKGNPLPYDQLVIACGSRSHKPDWPVNELKGVQGFYSYQDLELMEAQTKNISQAVIIGGGLIGIEMAEMLRSRRIPVIMIIKDKFYWNSVLPEEEAKMIERHLAEHHVALIKEDELAGIYDENGSRNVHHLITKTGKKIDCQFIGLTVGVRANIAFLKDSGIEADKGILVDEFMETSVIDIFAIGDCVQYRNPPEGHKEIEQIWYTGRMHGEVLGRTLAGNKTAYTPGPWFNSAKFFDIEYQTYGIVLPRPNDDQDTFYWEHPEGKISFRATFSRDKKTLQGVNVMGFRLRHQLLDKWLQERKDMDYVMAHLEDANFDPELFRHHAPFILKTYNDAQKTTISLLPKSWKRILGLTS